MVTGKIKLKNALWGFFLEILLVSCSEENNCCRGWFCSGRAQCEGTRKMRMERWRRAVVVKSLFFWANNNWRGGGGRAGGRARGQTKRKSFWRNGGRCFFALIFVLSSSNGRSMGNKACLRIRRLHSLFVWLHCRFALQRRAASVRFVPHPWPLWLSCTLVISQVQSAEARRPLYRPPVGCLLCSCTRFANRARRLCCQSGWRWHFHASLWGIASSSHLFSVVDGCLLVS